jgi:carbamoyl-phosphate synthase large subunit
VPFVAKAIGLPLARIAARVMAGERLADFDLSTSAAGHVAVKEAVLPFGRFPGVDTLLGPEMKSTGEVMGLDRDFGRAFAKSQIAAGTRLPVSGTAFLSVKDSDKPAIAEIAGRLVEMDFRLIATGGTARSLAERNFTVERGNKVLEGQPHIVDRIQDGDVQLMLNTTEGAQAIADSYSLRRSALTENVPYYTTIAGAEAAVMAIASLRAGPLEVASLQSYSTRVDAETSSAATGRQPEAEL